MPILLVDAHAELLDAAVDDEGRLAQLLDARIAPGWAVFPEALVHIRASAPAAESGWGTVFFVTPDPRVLAGYGGYKGPPREGKVEIGYAIAPSLRSRGLATAAARGLVARAFADPRVDAVDAHTLATPGPSTRVLQRLGMTRIGAFTDPDDGEVWHWRVGR